MLFFFFPTATDAPCYHIPFAALGMIVFNILVLVIQSLFPEFTEMFVLRFGTVNPVTWLSSACMHVGVMHLIGNMVCLAVCGWIIEGKVGWWRFLAIYFGLAAASGMLVQLITIGFDSGGALGASGVIFGMFAILLLWAPENEITLVVVGVILFRPLFTTITVPLLGFAFFMIAIEFLTAAFTGFGMSSAVLHLIGVVPGVVLGVAMLKLRWVDCEGFDLLSIQQGKRGQRTLTVQQEREQEKAKQERAEARKLDYRTGKAKIAQYIGNGHLEMAVLKESQLRKEFPQYQFSEAQLVKLIHDFWKQPDKRAQAIPLIDRYLNSYASLRVSMTLKLARYRLLVDKQPATCRELLKSIRLEAMDADQKNLFRQLASKSQQLLRAQQA